MPRQTREQRREEEDRKGREWARWLTEAMTETPIDVKTLVERARREGATFDKTNVSRWLSGQKNAEPHHAVIVARILRRDPADALRAAGHDSLAESLTQSIAEAAARARVDREAELREQLAGLNGELDARLARYLTSPAPPGIAQNEREGQGAS